MNKQMVFILGLVTVIVILVFAVVAFSGSEDKITETAGTPSDVSTHHGSAVVNEEQFQSLIGKIAPDFTLESYDQGQVNLQELRGKKVVLFFTEGLMCYPSCWNQMAAFGKDSAFNNKDTITLSITVDPKNDWRQAVEKMPELASATVLFDTNREVSANYGVLTLPSSMHRGQFPGHTYLILDKEGIVRFIKDDPQMGVRNDELRIELGKIK